MAVYTQVSSEDLLAFLARFNVGTLESVKGIAEGVENTNYLIDTSHARFILTLYEKRVQIDDLPFFIGLMNHLADAGLPVPRAVADRDGQTLHDLSGRKACLIQFLPGVSVTDPAPAHARAVGAALAQMRDAGGTFTLSRDNDLSLAGWQQLAVACAPHAESLEPGLAALIRSSLADLEGHWPSDLPRSLIHADLFPDNVLFLGDSISGIIDFYFACRDIAAYDLAVCLNAWGFDAQGHHARQPLMEALLDGYVQVHPLTAAEHAALPLLAQGAALRFLLSRLYDWVHTPPDALVTRKDPLAYARRLAWWRTHA